MKLTKKHKIWISVACVGAVLIAAAVTVLILLQFRNDKTSLEQKFEKNAAVLRGIGFDITRDPSYISDMCVSLGISSPPEAMLVSENDKLFGFEFFSSSEAESFAVLYGKKFASVAIDKNVVLASQSLYYCLLLDFPLHQIGTSIVLSFDKEHVLVSSGGRQPPSGLTAVGYRAFSNDTEEIVLPDTVKALDNEAFFGLSSLKKVTFPQSARVSAVGTNCFAYCGALEALSLPAENLNVGAHAFVGCVALKTVTFEGEVQTLGGGAFNECASLIDVTFKAGGFINDGGLIFDQKKSLLYKALGQIRGSVTLPDTVQVIGEGAFSNQLKLQNVSGAFVSEIQAEAFKNCISMRTAQSAEQALAIGDSAYLNCPLSSVSLSGKLKTIGENAFRNTALKSLRIPASTESIGNYAFEGTNNLRSIVFEGAAPPVVGENVFSGTYRLFVPDVNRYADNFRDYEKALYPTSSINGDYALATYAEGVEIVQYLGDAESVTVPKSIGGKEIVKIGNRAFYGLSFLKSISFAPDSGLKEISNYAFASNYGLTEAELPRDLLRIESFAFDGCANLSRVSLPDQVNFIGDKAFQNTKWLSSQRGFVMGGDHWLIAVKADGDLELPSGTKTVGYRAASGSTVTSLTLAPETTAVLDYAFASQTQMKYLDLKNVKTISPLAFSSAESLKTLIIPISVEFIGAQAFYKSGMEEVIVLSEIPCSAKADMFLYPLSKMTVYVPDAAFCTAKNGELCNHVKGKSGCYRHAPGWANYKSAMMKMSDRAA